MLILNRQINTDFNKQKDDSFMIIEVTEDTKVYGKSYPKGKTFKCTRSEARRLMSINSKVFKIKVD